MSIYSPYSAGTYIGILIAAPLIIRGAQHLSRCCRSVDQRPSRPQEVQDEVLKKLKEVHLDNVHQRWITDNANVYLIDTGQRLELLLLNSGKHWWEPITGSSAENKREFIQAFRGYDIDVDQNGSVKFSIINAIAAPLITGSQEQISFYQNDSKIKWVRIFKKDSYTVTISGTLSKKPRDLDLSQVASKAYAVSHHVGIDRDSFHHKMGLARFIENRTPNPTTPCSRSIDFTQTAFVSDVDKSKRINSDYSVVSLLYSNSNPKREGNPSEKIKACVDGITLYMGGHAMLIIESAKMGIKTTKRYHVSEGDNGRCKLGRVPYIYEKNDHPKATWTVRSDLARSAAQQLVKRETDNPRPFKWAGGLVSKKTWSQQHNCLTWAAELLLQMNINIPLFRDSGVMCLPNVLVPKAKKGAAYDEPRFVNKAIQWTEPFLQ